MLGFGRLRAGPLLRKAKSNGPADSAFKVVVLGEPGEGKTVTSALIQGKRRPDQYEPTISREQQIVGRCLVITEEVPNRHDPQLPDPEDLVDHDLVLLSYRADRPKKNDVCLFESTEDSLHYEVGDWLTEYNTAERGKSCLLGDWLRNYEKIYRKPAPLVMVGYSKGNNGDDAGRVLMRRIVRGPAQSHVCLDFRVDILEPETAFKLCSMVQDQVEGRNASLGQRLHLEEDQ